MISQIAGAPVKVEFSIIHEDSVHETPAKPKVNVQQMRRQIAAHPLVERATELFDAEIAKVDLPR